MKRVILFLAAAVVCLSSWAQNPNFDSLMRGAGMCDVQSLDSTIRVRLMYSTEDNFVGKDMYGELEKAYLERDFARKVAKAQSLLRAVHPQYSLLVLDAARPISVQRTMRALVEGTPLQIYVADATRGGRHNYGVAVDLTITDESGRALDMGSAFDHFGEEAHLGNEAALVAEGRMSAAARKNRALLVDIMQRAGFVPYTKEWWHWQEPMSMSDTRLTYKLLNF